MKKLLSFLGALGLTAVGAAGVVSCGTSESTDSSNVKVENGIVTYTKDVKLDGSDTIKDKVSGVDVSALLSLKDGETDIPMTSAKFTAKDAPKTPEVKADDESESGKGKDATPAPKAVEGTLVVTFAAPKADDKTDKTYSYKLTTKDAKAVNKIDETIKFTIKKAETPKTVTLKDAKWVDATHVTVTTTNIPDGKVDGVTIKDNAKESPVTVNVKSATEAKGTLTIELDGEGIAQTAAEQTFTITVSGQTTTLTVAAQEA